MKKAAIHVMPFSYGMWEPAMKLTAYQPGSRHPRGPTGHAISGRPRLAEYTLALLIIILLSFSVPLWSTTRAHRHTVRIDVYPLSRKALAHEDVPIQKSQPATSHLRTDVQYWIDFAEQDALEHGMSITPTCDARLGRGFLQSFREASGTVCGREVTAASKVDCFAYPVKQEGLACTASNMLLDGSRFMGQGPTTRAANHNAYLPEGGVGSVQLGCALQSSNMTDVRVANNLQRELQPWLKKAYVKFDAEDVHNKCQQPGVSFQHPMLFISRLDPTNPYHHTQSVVQTFLTLAVLSNASRMARGESLQVVLADHFTEGPYTEIWKRLSYPHAVVFLNKLAAEKPVICLRKAVMAHYASPGCAFLGYEGVGQEFDCPSTLLMAVSHWLRYMFLDSFYLSAPGPTDRAAVIRSAKQVPTSQQQLNVVYVSRSWFERGMLAGGGLTGWQQQRMVPPDAEGAIITAIQRTVQQWNLRACVQPIFGWWQTPVEKPPPQGCTRTNVTFRFQVAELSNMDLHPDQVLLFSKTGVLVASHGAALTNQIFMRPLYGAVVEVWYDNYHYVNQAHMLGHKHIRTSSKADDMASAVLQAMDHVATRY